MNRKLLVILNAIALVITVAINYASNAGIFNGNTMATISARYNSLFTPAGYAFSIWGLIYFMLLLFIIYQFRIFSEKDRTEEKEVIDRTGPWFLISCIANSMWVIAWTYDQTGLSVLIMLLLLFSLLMIVIKTRIKLPPSSNKRKWLVSVPFSLYAGWITVATIANIAAYLVKINWDRFGLSDTTWTFIMIFTAGILHLLMLWTRRMAEFALVCVWALIAIAVANNVRSYPVALAAESVAAIILLNIFIHWMTKRRVSF